MSDREQMSADEIIWNIAGLIAGLEVPVSLGMGSNGMLGTAYGHWKALYDEIHIFGYAYAEEIEEVLRKRLSEGVSTFSDSHHAHVWVDARNEVVVSGSYCSICGALRAENA